MNEFSSRYLCDDTPRWCRLLFFPSPSSPRWFSVLATSCRAPCNGHMLFTVFTLRPSDRNLIYIYIFLPGPGQWYISFHSAAIVCWCRERAFTPRFPNASNSIQYVWCSVTHICVAVFYQTHGIYIFVYPSYCFYFLFSFALNCFFFFFCSIFRLFFVRFAEHLKNHKK